MSLLADIVMPLDVRSITGVFLEGSFVGLDLGAGRYFLLDDKDSLALWQGLRGTADPSMHVRLEALGLAHNHSLHVAVASAEPPQADWNSLAVPRVSLIDMLRVLLAWRRAARDLRRVHIGTMLGSLPPPGGRIADPRRAGALAAALDRAGLLRTAEGACLPRAIAMRRLLARSGIDARLVIGVRLPFLAHAWVEVAGTVMTDRLDAVLPFTPILSR
ncbi:lasso peptide biosynthesis B2 protein [Sphingomonas sp. FW199]|uniref:lasso peptide biosynthesis B2 protein n=1 Tax=Sphingomonas sp. FW199 TaxID=3400217 RepID=UPI003CF1F703